MSDQTILALHKKVITHNSRVMVTHDEQNTWNLILKQVGVITTTSYLAEATHSLVDADFVVLLNLYWGAFLLHTLIWKIRNCIDAEKNFT